MGYGAGGIADDTTALTPPLAAAEDGAVYFPSGKYVLHNVLVTGNW